MNDFKDYLELLRREARSIKSESENTLRRVQECHRLYMKELGGEFAERAKISRTEADQCLHHADKNVRIVGLETLQDVWQAKDTAFRAASEGIILHDADEQVRGVAIICLSNCYEATNDLRVGKMFAGLVRDDFLPTEIRTAAYFGLLIVNGVFQRQPELFLDFVFPEDVDPSYVDCFR